MNTCIVFHIREKTSQNINIIGTSVPSQFMIWTLQGILSNDVSNKDS